MKKKHLLGVIAAGLLLAGCSHTGETASQTPVTENAPAGESSAAEVGEGTTVSYTGSGFTPSTITVEAGITVTFVNNSSKSMWVASDAHPSHKDLLGFDQLKGSGNGTSYTYTFKKAGEWSYHNHLSAGQRGTVVVK